MDILDAIREANRDAQSITMLGKPYVAIPEAIWAQIRKAADWMEDQAEAAVERQETRQSDDFVRLHEARMAAA